MEESQFMTELQAEGVLAHEVFKNFCFGGFSEDQALRLTAYWLVAVGAQERLELEYEEIEETDE